MQEPATNLPPLEQRLKSVAPHALLVSEHIVRRAVRVDRAITGVRTFVPHTFALALEVGDLAKALSHDELGELHARDGWVILVTRPDGDDTTAVWRRLFHARVDEELGRLLQRGQLGAVRVRELIDKIGQVPMDEARTVLVDEGLVVAGDPTRELMELIALHAELRHFAPELMAHTFPSLAARGDIAVLFDGLVDSAQLFAETRLEGALTPGETGVSRREDLPTWRIPRLLEAARRAAQHGRDVDAALNAWRMGHVAVPASSEHEQARVLESEAVTALARKLAALAGEDEGEWVALISSLLPHAHWGMTSVAGRLLHDLQRACDAGEGELWSLDLGRVLRSGFKAPLKKQEVVRQKVAVARHVARALSRLASTRLVEAERRRGQRALRALSRRWEEVVRHDVGAILEEGVGVAGLVPRDIPEEVARDKLVAELCDRLLDKGFIAFADVRDLVARNQLKLSDRGLSVLVTRDELLRFDGFAKQRLGGAYRPAEVYRRFFHRMSALVFANPVGRLAVRYGALPFGGAFVLVKGFDLVILSLVAMVLGLEAVPPPPGSPEGTPHEHALQVFSLPLMLTVGVVLFMLLHVPQVRTQASRLLRRVGRGLRFILVTLPRRFRALPWVERLVRTRAFGFVHDHLWRPLLYAVIPTALAVAFAGDTRMWWWVGLPVTVAWSVFFATRPGRRFIEAARDWGLIALRDLRHDIVPGLIAAVLELFKAIVDRVEVVLYVVDQKLRYHRGDGRLGVGVRAVAGLLWSMLAYLVRLIVNLVAEPQLNPIKHFPVVTIAHKVTIPWSIAVHQSLKDAGLSEAMASMLGLGAFQLVVPGIAGFLVWELKENWRLYAANRKAELVPVIVGSHGEPVYRFLRPGFHSGTVPQLFRKLRKAEKKGKAAIARRHLEALHHVEEAVERFVEREVKALLVRSGQWPEAGSLRVEHVVLSPARISLDIGCEAMGPSPLKLSFEEQSGFLIADVLDVGFLPRLGDASAPRRIAFATALLGLYKLAGVDLVRSHIAGVLPDTARFDVSERGLVVWDEGFTREQVYPLRLDDTALYATGGEGRPVPTERIAFRRRGVKWSDWSRAWSDAQSTRALRDQVLGEQLLLPRS